MFARRTSASAAAIVGFFAAAVLPRATWPLIDGDVWWHIRAGEEVVRTGRVPSVDTWSIVGAGRPWVSQDWLANVLLAAGNSLGPWGQTALSLLFGGIAVLAFWILWRAIALRVPGIGWVSRIVWLSIGLALGGPVMGVRVQVLDLLLAAVVMWICWRYLVDPRRRWLIGLPLLAAVWANLHAGWVLLFVIVGAVLAGEAADRLLGRQPNGVSALSWGHLRDLGVAMLAALAALAANPNGVALYGYPFYTLGITALGRYVMEWFPASLGDLFGQMLAAFVVIGVVPAMIFGRRGLRTADTLILVGLCLMAWRAIRFLLIVGPIGGAIVAVLLAPVISQTALGRRAGPILARLSGPPVRARGWLNAGLAAFLLALGLSISVLRVSPPAQNVEIARVLPAQAAAWLDLHEQGTRLFNRYEWGGYLGEHRPSQLVFMDGRADVYGDALLQQYVSIISVEGDPQATLDRYGIDHAVFPPDTPLAAWFDASVNWTRVYTDATAAVWVRR